jgi:hypothetical protein
MKTKIENLETIIVDDKEMIVKSVDYEGNGTYTIVLDDLEDKTTNEFIEDYKKMFYENKQLKRELENEKLKNKSIELGYSEIITINGMRHEIVGWSINIGDKSISEINFEIIK